jgi:hypothetical protein
VKASTQIIITKKVGPCGGGGGAVKDMNVDGITRIVKISVRHGAAIDGLTVRFLRNGREESTELWGRQGGNMTEVPPFCILNFTLVDLNILNEKVEALISW